MTAIRVVPGRFGIAATIARREAMASMRGFGFYVAIAVAMAAATWMLLVDLRAVEEAGILVRAEAFGAPLVVAMLILGIFLAVAATVSVVRDRNRGTLEVLFYGPVDETSYVLGTVGGMLTGFIIALPLVVAGLFLLSVMTGFLLTPSIYAGVAVSVVPAAEIISLGVLISVCASRVRSAVLAAIGLIAFLVGVTVAYEMVLLVPIEEASSPVIPLRDALRTLNTIVLLISPFAHLERIVDAVAAESWRRAGLDLLLSLGLSLALIAAAIAWLRRRGVHGARE